MKDSTANISSTLLPPLTRNQLTYNPEKNVFLTLGYTSASGNRSYIGMRFCDRFAVVEKVGMFHNWTYINSLELYVYNMDNVVLAQKEDFYKEFRNEEFIREESKRMVETYLLSMMKSKNIAASEEVVATVKKQADVLVRKCYKNFFDVDFNTMLMKKLILQIERR